MINGHSGVLFINELKNSEVEGILYSRIMV